MPEGFKGRWIKEGLSLKSAGGRGDLRVKVINFAPTGKDREQDSSAESR